MIKGNLVLIRAPELEDVDMLYHLENDTKFWHISQTFKPISRFDLEEYILIREKDPFKAGQVRFMIETIQPKQVVGTIDLFDINVVNQRAGVGILLLEKHQGKGYAAEALRLIVKYAFEILELHQVYCNIEDDNNKSLKLFTGNGFEITGRKKEWNRKNGRWVDEYFLQLINKS